MQNKNYSGPQLGPRWAAQVSSQPSYMHANIKISVGPNWAPDGLAQMGSPLGTHLKTVAKVNWAPSGLPTWGPSDSPSGPHLWPSCTCWLGSTFFTKFESLLEFHISSKVDLIFVGDFNIHVDDLNDSNSLYISQAIKYV